MLRVSSKSKPGTAALCSDLSNWINSYPYKAEAHEY